MAIIDPAGDLRQAGLWALRPLASTQTLDSDREVLRTVIDHLKLGRVDLLGLSMGALVDRVDAALGEENDEYLTKRKSLRYGAPVIRVVRPGEFDRYRRRMVETGQRADGQFKVLRLTADVSSAAEFAAERDLVGSERTKA